MAAGEAVDISYQPLPCVTVATAALQPDAPLLWKEAPGNSAFLFRKGDAASAVKHLKTALFHNPKFCQGHNNIGVAYLRLGDAERATEHLEAALRHCPKYGKTAITRCCVPAKLRRRTSIPWC